MKCKLCKTGVVESVVHVVHNKEIIIKAHSLLDAEKQLFQFLKENPLYNKDMDYCLISLYDICNKCLNQTLKTEKILILNFD